MLDETFSMQDTVTLQTSTGIRLKSLRLVRLSTEQIHIGFLEINYHGFPQGILGTALAEGAEK